MGEKAFQLTDKEILVSTVMTTFLQGAYYETEKEETKKITELAKKLDPLFVAKLALYARKEGNLRSVTHLLAAIVAGNARGAEYTGVVEYPYKCIDKEPYPECIPYAGNEKLLGTWTPKL